MVATTRRRFIQGMGALAFVPGSGLAPAAEGATTGTIRGRITVRQGRRQHGYDQVIVHVVGARQVPRVRGVQHVIRQKDMQFQPRISAVVVGTTLSFPNDDDVYHNVYSDSSALRFTAYTPRGESYSRMARKTGRIEILCDRHAEMRADVLVLDTDLFERPDPDGTYQIAGVPAGTHTVEVWQPHGKVYQRKVTVTAGQVVTHDQLVVPGTPKRRVRSDGSLPKPY